MYDDFALYENRVLVLRIHHVSSLLCVLQNAAFAAIETRSWRSEDTVLRCSRWWRCCADACVACAVLLRIVGSLLQCCCIVAYLHSSVGESLKLYPYEWPRACYTWTKLARGTKHRASYILHQGRGPGRQSPGTKNGTQVNITQVITYPSTTKTQSCFTSAIE